MIAKLAAVFLREKTMAIVIGKVIYLHNISELNFKNNRRHFAHEMCHIKQFETYGFIQFIMLYLFESIKNGYYNNKFEIEARNAEKEAK